MDPFKGVILFVVVLMLSNFFWKYNVLGDEAERGDSIVTFFGFGISEPFVWMAHHVSQTTYGILHFFSSAVHLQSEQNIFYYPNGNSVRVIWACTGIKQAYITFCIFAFARGPWLKKLWYVPIALLVGYLFNIFRIAFITACIENHPDWFEWLHLYFFKYLFYGIIFLLWVYWEEKIVNQEFQQKKTKN